MLLLHSSHYSPVMSPPSVPFGHRLALLRQTLEVIDGAKGFHQILFMHTTRYEAITYRHLLFNNLQLTKKQLESQLTFCQFRFRTSKDKLLHRLVFILSKGRCRLCPSGINLWMHCPFFCTLRVSNNRKSSTIYDPIKMSHSIHMLRIQIDQSASTTSKCPSLEATYLKGSFPLYSVRL